MMKTKKWIARFFALCLTLSFVALASCGGQVDTSSTKDSDKSTSGSPASSDSAGGNSGSESQKPEPEVAYGLPTAAIGRYIKDADLVEDGAVRYLAYTTNEESGEEDNVVAVRKASFTEGKGWAYGDENIALRGTADGWDEYIGSASLVKGAFTLQGETYDWLMAYCATSQTSDTQYEIGLAVAKTPEGSWTKVSDKPLVGFDGEVYGSSSVGCYAPSLVNLDKQSVVRVFYTYADMYGHFAKFVDINAADVGKLFTEEAEKDVTLISGTVQIPTNGDVAGGDLETMFPNADFAYDETNGKFYAVKDYSPSAATTPAYAEKIELTAIAEEELYTAEILEGWKSVRLWDMTDTPDMAYERLYGGCVVSDAYGHIDGTKKAEIVYNVCEIAQENENWMFTQNLLSFEEELA